MYYNLLSVLTSVILEAVGSTRSRPASERLAGLVDSGVESLEVLLDLTAARISAGNEEEPRSSLLLFASLLPISYVRDAASAAIAAAAYVTAHHDRQVSRDRTGETSLRKEALAGIKTLDSAAKEAGKEGAGWITAVRPVVGKASFVQAITAFVNEGEEGRAELEGAVRAVLRGEGEGEVNIWGKRVVDGWRANVEGWSHVKWE